MTAIYESNSLILQDAIVKLVNYYQSNERLSNDFLLKITHSFSDPSGKTDYINSNHYILGDVDWNQQANRNNEYQHSYSYKELGDIENFLKSFPFFDTSDITLKGSKNHRLEFRLVSNDLIYGIKFGIANTIPVIIIDLASAIFGKGVFYEYSKLAYKVKKWHLFSQYERGKVYNRYKGELIECLDYFFETERKMEHPYQWMVDKHPEVYKNATQTKRSTA